MSWRMHLAVVDTAKIENTRNMPPQYYAYDSEVDDCGDTVAFYKFVENDFGQKDDYCIGRLPISKEIGIPFYSNSETQKLFVHYNPRIINKEDFESIIDLMRKNIAEYYKELLTFAPKAKPEYWQKVLEDKLDTWEAPFIMPYNLKPDSKFMVNSFDSEYQIWDMIRMYKTVDWENDTVIFYGW